MTIFGLLNSICLAIQDLSLVRLRFLFLFDDFSDFGCHVGRWHTMSANITQLLGSCLFCAFARERSIHLGLLNFFWFHDGRMRGLCTATRRVYATEHIISRRKLLEILLCRKCRVNHAFYDSRFLCFGHGEAFWGIQRLKVVICVPNMPLLGNTTETVLHFILLLI